MPVCEMELMVGGKYRWRNDDGQEFGCTGIFREVSPMVKLVHTQIYDPGTVGGEMGDEAIITVEFAEKDGRTIVATTMDYGSKEARNAATSTGMTDGMEMSYQSLDKLLAEWKLLRNHIK